ncbi:DgyrCDS2058 [Dimorphilus gyrociliatus]|uniref:DgyrCDS2058 n=1 Tax=Dimorphilus gyrociliatus TaxID=2664684 RepID=A0A7I8V956_9ANNE|nr:DgyrCDS2058 [Dimorphilus gyrociliatus]
MLRLVNLLYYLVQIVLICDYVKRSTSHGSLPDEEPLKLQLDDYHRFTCQESTLKIKCYPDEGNFMVIESAVYGRRKEEICNPQKFQTCYDPNAIASVQRLCFGTTYCEVPVNDREFSNPCLPDIEKYLETEHQCADDFIYMCSGKDKVVRIDEPKTGYITTFNYPKGMPPRSSCKLDLRTNPGQHLQVQILHMPDEANANQCSTLVIEDIDNNDRRLSVPSCNRTDEQTDGIFKHLRVDYQGGTRRRGFLIKYTG